MKIMVCYTNSPASKDALREAQKHAKVWNASIEVVKVVERSQPIKRSRLQEMEAAFEHEIDLLLEAEESVYTVQLQIDDLEAGEKIVQIAKRKKVDLIFIGLKKRSKVGKLLFGSTARFVILNAPCPVVSVNPV